MSGQVRSGWSGFDEVRSLDETRVLTFSETIDALEALGCEPAEVSHESYASYCPVHRDPDSDQNTTTTMRNGHPVTTCWSRKCDRGEIMDALQSVEPVDRVERKPRYAKLKGKPKRWYDYHDENGDLARRVTIYRDDDDKRTAAPQEIIDPRKLLFMLPAVMQWVADGETIYLCEGESDALALEATGEAATCSPEGAGARAKLDPSMVALLAPVLVKVIGDNDEAGTKGAVALVGVLKAAGVDVSLWYPPAPHKDVRDLLEAGGVVGDLVETSWYKKKALPFVRASSRTKKNVQWLWKGRIPVGALTIVAGEQGNGKSTLMMGLAALLTQGKPIPGDTTKRKRSRVLILDYEGAIDETLIPKAEACGVDMGMLDLLDVSMLDDTEIHLLVEEYLQENPDCGLVVADPILSVIPGDTFKNNEVRKALKPWQGMAERHRIAMIGLMHMRKAEADRLIHRVSESGAFTQVARSVLYVGKHPESGRRSVSSLKNNLGPEPLPIEFVIEGKAVADINDPVANVVWVGEAAELNADDMCKGPGRPADKSEAAENFLYEYLTTVRTATETITAAIAKGHAEGTVKKVARRMSADGTISKHQEKGVWYWQIGEE